MVKQFTVPCDFKGGKKLPVTFYIGNPSDQSSPLHFQAKWLSEKKGGSVPEDITKSFAELQKIAIRNRVSFEELCHYVIDELNNKREVISESKKAYKGIEAATAAQNNKTE